jgi:hypothetical protein
MNVYLSSYKAAALDTVDNMARSIKKNFEDMDFENASSRTYFENRIDEMLREISIAKSSISIRYFYSI